MSDSNSAFETIWLQQQTQQQTQQQQQQLQLQPPGSIGLPVSTSYTSLTSELQLIEKTIIDREMELQINTCMQKESPQGLDYGSYIAHGKIFRKMFYCSLINLGSITLSLLHLFCMYL